MNNTKKHPGGLILGLLALHCSVCLLVPLGLVGGVSIAAVLTFILSPIFLLPAALIAVLAVNWAIRRGMS